MLILDTNTRSLQVVLGTAKTTNDMAVAGCFVNHNSVFEVTALTSFGANTNGTTAVTLVAAPASGQVRQVKNLTIINLDTTGKQVTVRLNDNNTLRSLITVFLDANDVLQYSDGDGWEVLTGTGAVKSAATSTVMDNSLTSPKYVDGSVTNAKLSDMASNTIKGRTAGTAGAPENLSAASVFGMLKGVIPMSFAFGASDEISPLTVGNDKVKGLRIPHAMSLTSITGSLSGEQTGGSVLTVDVRRAGTSLFSSSGKMVFTNNQRLAPSPVLATSPTALVAQDEISVDVLQIGTSGARGLKITLHGFFG